MKKFARTFLVFFVAFLIAAPLAGASGKVSPDGTFHGKKLAGKVRIVEHNADFKVKVVSSFPDLKVKIVNSFPSKPGEWQFVTYGGDFTIQYVESFPDFTIRFVDSFPGVG